MKFGKKDLIYLLVPLIVLAVIYPFLPARIPRQFTLGGQIKYMNKQFVFLVGLLPYVVFKSHQIKHNK